MDAKPPGAGKGSVPASGAAPGRGVPADADRLRLETGGGMRYLLSVPSGALDPPDSGWPVLCFLHGYDEGSPRDIRDGLTRHGPLRAGGPDRVREEFLILAPQLPLRGDFWQGQAEEVERIVRAVQGEHGGDPERTYLTGFSFGGNGVFDLALLQPELWAALWAVDPTRAPPRDPEFPVWLSAGEIARRGLDGFVQALGLQPWSGDDGVDRVFLDQAADHVGSAALAYADPRIYHWLLDRRRRPA